MAKASLTQAWLWHRRLSHLNFDYINLLSKKDVVIGLPKLKYVKDQLCSSCEVSKSKRSSFKSKTVPSSKGRLNLLYMDLCGLMRVVSIKGKIYILGLVPQRQKASDYDNPDPAPELQNVSPSADTTCVMLNRKTIKGKHNGCSAMVEAMQEELHQLTDYKSRNSLDKTFWQEYGFVYPDHPDKVYRLRKLYMDFETSSMEPGLQIFFPIPTKKNYAFELESLYMEYLWNLPDHRHKNRKVAKYDQDGRIKIKDLERNAKVKRQWTKAHDQRSQSMKEQAYIVAETNDSQELQTKAFSLIFTKEYPMELTFGL
ncbi:retrovirus-related pol polyprotein from transposon TNT 1-94 [Tanacetum coccineum]